MRKELVWGRQARKLGKNGVSECGNGMGIRGQVSRYRSSATTKEGDAGLSGNYCRGAEVINNQFQLGGASHIVEGPETNAFDRLGAI
jgi:hypothetical protein